MKWFLHESVPNHPERRKSRRPHPPPGGSHASRARSMNSSGRSTCSGRASRFAYTDRARRHRLDDLLGAARRRQDHAGARSSPASPRPSSSNSPRCSPASRKSSRSWPTPSAPRQYGTRTIVFIDEIHRFNKAQQDAFLPYVEKGNIRLIGATTENPSFEIISALLSRMPRFRAASR